jgi:A/G-specific adenine glycosylase
VLARHEGVDGAIDDQTTLERLWRLAEGHTPRESVAVYTQAVMDLGATVCTRANPRCDDCPVATDCRARIEGRQSQLPAGKRRRAPRPLRRAVMLVARRESSVLLVQRPATGIWGGLWCLPEFADRDSAAAFAVSDLRTRLARAAMPDIEHRFTHFDLVITPVVATCRGRARVREGNTLWYDLAEPARVGLPAPIKALLGSLTES